MSKLREEMSQNELLMIEAIGIKKHVDLLDIDADIDVPSFLRIVGLDCFQDEHEGPAVDALRKALRASTQCNPYRNTPEYENLIKIDYLKGVPVESVHAIINWISKENGGRNNLPSGIVVEGSIPYSPVVVFDNDDSNGSWSLSIEKQIQSDDGTWLARIKFVSPDAPHEKLIKNRTFHLCEGQKCVANGIVV